MGKLVHLWKRSGNWWPRTIYHTFGFVCLVPHREFVFDVCKQRSWIELKGLGFNFRSFFQFTRQLIARNLKRRRFFGVLGCWGYGKVSVMLFEDLEGQAHYRTDGPQILFSYLLSILFNKVMRVRAEIKPIFITLFRDGCVPAIISLRHSRYHRGTRSPRKARVLSLNKEFDNKDPWLDLHLHFVTEFDTHASNWFHCHVKFFVRTKQRFTV